MNSCEAFAESEDQLRMLKEEIPGPVDAALVPVAATVPGKPGGRPGNRYAAALKALGR